MKLKVYQTNLLFLQMEKNAAAGRTPSSLPISTPPPSALTGSSPEYAPLSPVHTNSLNDAKSLNVKSEPTNFHLPPPYTDDNRTGNVITSRGLMSGNSLGDQRNEKFISGGNVGTFELAFFFYVCFINSRSHRLDTAVPSGTLDAIRERMKSMQLAASAGNPDSGSRPFTRVNENFNNGFSGQAPRGSDSIGDENPVQGGVLPMDEKALSGLQARMERLKSGAIDPL